MCSDFTEGKIPVEVKWNLFAKQLAKRLSSCIWERKKFLQKERKFNKQKGISNKSASLLNWSKVFLKYRRYETFHSCVGAEKSGFHDSP